MDQAKKTANASISKDQAEFKKVKIKFDSKYSYSYPDQAIISGKPTEILIMGNGKGNYLNGNGEGKNFETVTGGSLSSVAAFEGNVGGRSKINLNKILIERSIIVNALGPNKITDAKADSTNPKKLEEGVISVEDFLDNIFQVIGIATGGMLKLRLIQNPDIHAQEGLGSSEYELLVVDENNGYMGEAIKCIKFNPIDGDGNTRSCTITSNVGSKEYQGSLFAGSMKKADPIFEVTGDVSDGNTSGRSNERHNAISDIIKIIRIPGSLGDSQFDNVHMESIVALLGTIRMGSPVSKKFDMLVYPGIGIDIEIDGLFGFVPGNAVMTTQLPAAYYDAKAYFWVNTVEHRFVGDTSDWSTKITGQLSFNDAVTYIGL